MNKLINAPQPSLPGLPTAAIPARVAEARRIIGEHAVWDEGRQTMVQTLPTREEREVLGEQLEHLQQTLRPAESDALGRKAIKDKMLSFFNGYPSLRNADAQVMLSAYVDHLKEYPAWVVISAIDKIIRGEVVDVDPRTQREIPLDPDWPPSSIRIATVAKVIMRAPAEEVAKISRLLRARQAPPELTPEQRRLTIPRVQRMADAARAQLSPKPTREEQEAENARAKARVAESLAYQRELAERQWRAEGYEPMENSDGSLSSVSFLKSLHRWPPQGAKKIES